MSSPSPSADPRPVGAWQLGSIAGAPLYVQRSWLLVAALIAVVFAPRVDQVAPGLGNLAYVAGLGVAVLLYLSVLLHEVSHALMAQAFGMRVVSVTLHFLGGVTQIEQEADTPKREFWIAGSLARNRATVSDWVAPPQMNDATTAARAKSSRDGSVPNRADIKNG